MQEPVSVTELLMRWRGGDAHALDRLVPIVYGELRRLAQYHLGSERSDHTLQATALVHEAYLRLTGKDHPKWRDRTHFFAVAAMVMRRILIDDARRRSAVRHGGDLLRVPLEETPLVDDGKLDLLALDECLCSLAKVDRRKSQVVSLRFFCGLTATETAQALGISVASVKRDWKLAKAWLLRELENGASERTAPS